jgi:TorA maturation chaperone TorD
MKSDAEKAALDQSRAALYHLLAMFYLQEPTPQRLGELKTAGFFTLAEKVGISFGEVDAESEAFCEELAVEFTRLFIGHGQHISPYASVHRSDDKFAGQLWSETTAEVKRFIEHYGFKISQPGLLPDHIGILFEFMNRLIRGEIEAEASGDEEAAGTSEETQLRFFADYIHPWVDRFLAEVRDADPAPFYHALVQLTDWFIEEERERFQIQGADTL